MKDSIEYYDQEVSTGEEPGSLQTGLSSKKVVQDYEQPTRFSRRNEYCGKKSKGDSHATKCR